MEKRNRAKPSKERRPRKRKQRTEQDLVYTQPKPFFRNRLMVQLLTIAAVVLAFTIGVSIFFKVETMTVSGAQKHSAWAVVQASGIDTGDSLLFFGRAKAAGNIKKRMPYVDTVQFRVTLPNTVNIIITEKPVAYGLQAEDGSWWMMTSDGIIAEQVSGEAAEKNPRISGILLKEPIVGQQAVASELQKARIGDTTVTAADRLKAVLQILHELERNALFAEISQIDVADIFAMRLYFGDRYRVELGDSRDMAEKIALIRTTLEQLDGEDSGVLKLLYIDEKWQVMHQSWSQQ